ncbi:SH3 domain-containing protein [Aggregatilinea lenta]|uniref:SH3 domain-containing protein n=1 Tax=Aggregatilinea lenta TaxID=913108 RepID=UPI000E5B3E39|nr:SH3 domain-containing protein [Aggregatilinea lenta]
MKVVRSITLIMLLILSVAALLPASGAQAQGECAGAPAPRLTKGQMARVTLSEGTGNNLRATPSSAGTVLGVMSEGEIFTVTSDPQCVEGFYWWQIRRWDGQGGFTAEGANGEYWVEPWPQDGATIPTVAAPTAETGLIAFGRSTDETTGQIFVMVADGSREVLVSGEVVSAGQPAWSPDVTRIAFTGGSEEAVTTVYVVDADGQNLITMPGDFSTVRDPQWSPDGTQIVFAAAGSAAAPNSPFDLYVVNADGTGLKNLSNTPDIDETNPAWSPDGGQIAFTSTQEGSADVIVTDAGGFSATIIAATNAIEFKPAWSPDGAWIAYYATNEDGVALMIADPLGTSSAQIGQIYDERSNSHAPVFSPDGTRIAYSTVSSLADSATSELFSVRTDGTDPIQYTADGAIALAPSWSPDGQWLVFSSTRADTFDLWAMRANGAGIAQLTRGADMEYTPQWSPRSATLPAATGTPAEPAVTTVPGEAELLLIYDAGVPMFTLKNQSSAALNLLPVSFSGAGVVVPATIWSTEFLASPLNAFKAGGCLQMWQFGLPQQDAPAECGDSRQGWISEETGFFWTQGTFDVLYDGAVVATCETGAGRCEADLPIVQPVG